jgi:iron complex outermembrane receptor protein
MKRLSLLSLAAVAALATESVTIQKITVEASAPKSDTKSINADQIVKFSRQSDLGEMLSGALPEITHVRTSAIGNDIVLRGFKKDNLNVTIDDAKICGACPNRMDPPAMHISSSQIAGVEVQEGPFDVTQFGSLGGAINVVTKDPAKGLHGEVSATLGSYDYRKISTTLEGGNDSVQALVGYSRETSGQYKDGDGKTLSEQAESSTKPYSAAHKNDDAYERQNFWAKIVGNIDNNQKLTLSYFGDRADNVLYPRYPMDALMDDTDMFKAKYQLFNLGTFSEEFLIEAYHSKVEHDMGTDFRTGMSSVSLVDATIKGVRTENTALIAETEITFGLDLSTRNWNGTKGNRTNPYTTIQIPDVDTDNIGIYAKALKTLGSLDLSGGLRYDDTTIDPDQSLTGMATTKERDYDNISANVLGRYHYSTHGNFFVGAGQTSRVPDARELYFANVGNTNLNETINREIDMGIEHTLGNLHLKGTLFYSDLKDYIYAYKVVGMTTSFANIDARIVGGDITADYLLNNEWSLQSSIAYQKGTKKDVSQLDSLATLPQTDKDLADIPPLKGRVALVFDDSKNYAEAEFIAARHQTYDANNGEQAIGGYGILNLKYGTELGSGFSLTAGINNFFDRTYAVSNSYIGLTTVMEGAQPLVLNEPGRNFYTTLSYQF